MSIVDDRFNLFIGEKEMSHFPMIPFRNRATSVTLRLIKVAMTGLEMENMNCRTKYCHIIRFNHNL